MESLDLFAAQGKQLNSIEDIGNWLAMSEKTPANQSRFFGSIVAITAPEKLLTDEPVLFFVLAVYAKSNGDSCVTAVRYPSSSEKKSIGLMDIAFSIGSKFDGSDCRLIELVDHIDNDKDAISFPATVAEYLSSKGVQSVSGLIH